MDNGCVVRSGFANEDIFHVQVTNPDITIQIARAVKSESTDKVEKSGGYSALYTPDALYFAEHANDFGERLDPAKVVDPSYFGDLLGDFIEAVMVTRARVRAGLLVQAKRTADSLVDGDSAGMDLTVSLYAVLPVMKTLLEQFLVSSVQ